MSDENTLEIEKLVEWSDPKRVETKFGPKDLHTAKCATPLFWDAWRAAKEKLKEAGISVKKEGQMWQILWWKAISAEERERFKNSLEMSRALDAEIKVPSPENLEYLPFQRAGIKFMSTRPATCPNVLLGDEMGVGKTIQSAGLINYDENLKQILVVCPATLKLNWRKELKKWLVRGFSVSILKASYKKSEVFNPNADIIIVNYNLLKKHQEYLKSRSWDLLIVDECHMVKNPKAQRSKALFALNARKKLALTGTPILNRPKEIWPILAFLDPETWNKNGKGFISFARKYCAGYKDAMGHWHFDGNSKLDELQRRLRSTIMIRRLKSEVLTELPPKFRQVIEFPDSTGITKAHAAAMESFEATIAALRTRVELAKASDNQEDYNEAVEALKEGAQIKFTEMAKMRHDTAVAKIPVVTEHIRDMVDSGIKVIVFAHHRDVQDALMAEFKDIAVMHRGGMSDEARDLVVEQFQNDPKIKLFIGSIQASGVGITLTASSHVVFVELDWVPGIMSQAEDRAHRIGQVDNVTVQHLVLEGSIDANMAQTLIDKQAVIDKALDKKEKTVAENHVVLPVKTPAATEGTSRAKLDKIAETLTNKDCERIHAHLKTLAARCDYANALDGAGFNKIDAPIGHSLAQSPFLTPRQAALGSKLVQKYRRQLGLENG
jgi:SNF2 family DNA or RNA helicase